MFKYLFGTLAFLFLPVSAFAGGIVVENAWVREAPPISKVQAAYAKINNNKLNDVQLISASSPAFKKIEFHQTVTENGLSKMLHLPFLSIQSKEHISLEPEGVHMMLFNPSKPLRAGETINIIFNFSDNTVITTRFNVKKVTGSHSNHSKHH